MAQQLYLFTGDDHYRVDREVARWISGFENKHQTQAVIYRTDREPSDIITQLQGGGLFASQRMVVIYGAPVDKAGSYAPNAATIAPVMDQLKRLTDGDVRPDDLRVLLVSYQPDKRLTDYKRCKKHCSVKELGVLTPRRLVDWIMQDDESYDRTDVQYVVDVVGTETQRVMMELDKLVRYRRHYSLESLTDEQRTRLIVSDEDVDSFALVRLMHDSLSVVLDYVDQVRAGGDHWLKFWGGMSWAWRIVLQMTDLAVDGVSTKAMARIIGASPRTIGQYAKYVDKRVPIHGAIRGFFSTIVDIEYRAKTGRLSSDYVWLELKQAMTIYNNTLTDAK